MFVLAIRDDLMECDVRWHWILNICIPYSFFSPKGFREYPSHKEVKEKVKKRPKKERVEKPGKLAELVLLNRLHHGGLSWKGWPWLSFTS